MERVERTAKVSLQHHGQHSIVYTESLLYVVGILLYRIWADRAVEFLSVCREEEPILTRELMLRCSDDWGEESPLEIAVESENMKFVAHECVQQDLTEQWMGEIETRTSTRKVQWNKLACC